MDARVQRAVGLLHARHRHSGSRRATPDWTDEPHAGDVSGAVRGLPRRRGSRARHVAHHTELPGQAAARGGVRVGRAERLDRHAAVHVDARGATRE